MHSISTTSQRLTSGASAVYDGSSFAGVDETPGSAFDEELRAAKDVSGREEREAVAADFPSFVEGVRLVNRGRTLRSEAQRADARIVRRREDNVVNARVIRVSVRDVAPRART